jgi:hypothetical protein
VVRGTGGVSYAPQSDGNGLSFAKGGGQKTDTGFLVFTGTPVRNLFNPAGGELSFNLRSKYNLAERATAMPSETVFEVDDGAQRIFYFSVKVSNSRLVVNFSAGGALTNYYFPLGQEDTLFGKDKVARFRLTWNGTGATLFLNDTGVLTYSFTPLTANWAPSASFTIGASAVYAYGGGYYATADSIADFQIR